VNANQANFSVRAMCKVLQVSASGFYAWQERAPSKHAMDDAVLSERIRLIHSASGEIYGSPNIHAELRDEGLRVGRKRVARLMRDAGLRGVSRRRRYVVTTQRDAKQRPAPDLVNRQFVAQGPNQLWVADMTYIATWSGPIYLAIVVDVWSRRIVGWSIGETMTAELVLAALNMAGFQRRAREVIHHSDSKNVRASCSWADLTLTAMDRSGLVPRGALWWPDPHSDRPPTRVFPRTCRPLGSTLRRGLALADARDPRRA